MIQIENKIISKDVFEKQFICDLNACKGACCVEGDSGAPLLEDEIKKIEEIYDDVKEYMTRKGRGIIEEKGVYVIDSDGDVTTPLINDRQCAFVISENGISKCAIEKAYLDDKIDFKKPISCHLFPIRIKEYRDFDAINYEEIKICKPACECGSKLQVPVYVFLKESLIRRYGIVWYEKLLNVAKLVRKKEL